MRGISAFLRRAYFPTLCSLPGEEDITEDRVLQIKKWAFAGHWICWHLVFGLASLKNCKK